MKVNTGNSNLWKHVDGVITVGPILPNEPLELKRSRHGKPALSQKHRIVAISDYKPTLLSFATINGLAVVNYNELALHRKDPNNSIQVYSLDTQDASNTMDISGC